ncbi:MAG: hypothetical protein AABW75_04460 [Nanoarchaeota archaeon]
MFHVINKANYIIIHGKDRPLYRIKYSKDKKSNIMEMLYFIPQLEILKLKVINGMNTALDLQMES